MWQRTYTTYLPGLTCAIAFAAVLLLFGSISAYSQTTVPPPSEVRPSSEGPPSGRPSKSDKDDLGPDIGSHESEMKARLELRAEKKQYDDNLARAKETADIASQLVDSYQAKKSFSSEDTKKLERIEKLARRIRNEAGGMEADTDLKEIPAVVESAVKRLAEMADDLRKEVEKTPRHVISTSVIDQANKLIGFVQHVRDLAR
jgi:hypothetical protein